MATKEKDTAAVQAAATTAPAVDAQAEAEKILAEARAKAAEIVAEAKAAATTAPAEPDSDDGEQLVSIRLFKDNDKYKDDVFVAVNGERIQIKRGEAVQIKRKFADVLEESMKQDMSTASMIERESSEYEAKAASLNL